MAVHGSHRNPHLPPLPEVPPPSRRNFEPGRGTTESPIIGDLQWMIIEAHGPKTQRDLPFIE